MGRMQRAAMVAIFDDVTAKDRATKFEFDPKHLNQQIKKIHLELTFIYIKNCFYTQKAVLWGGKWTEIVLTYCWIKCHSERQVC